MGNGNVEWALQALYGADARLYDLTSAGYQKAIAGLRRDSPTMARRVERTLDPVLRKEKLFPRRARSWRESSEGRKVRLSLLPVNPHLQEDVGTIRQTLGIPKGHVRFTRGDPLVLELAEDLGEEAALKVAQENAAVRWIVVHQAQALAQALPFDPGDLLPYDMRDSAEAGATVQMGAVGPEWLRRIPEPPRGYCDTRVPLDWAVARLIERYRLPWWIVQSLKFYVITQNADYITGLEPFQVNVAIEGLPGRKPGAPKVTFGDNRSSASGIRITVHGVDEFTSQQDWLGIWRRYIRPEQDRFWNLRATRPEGRRRVDVRRLEKGLSTYTRMLEEGLSIGELISRGGPYWVPEDVEPETLRRIIRDLALVLAPTD